MSIREMRSFGIDDDSCVTSFVERFWFKRYKCNSSPAYRGGGLLAFVFDKAKEAEVLLPFDYLNPHRLRIVFYFV